jgi:hypothetical protein
MSAFGQPGISAGYGSGRRQRALQSQGQMDPYGNQVRQAMQPTGGQQGGGFQAYAPQAPQQGGKAAGGFQAYAQPQAMGAPAGQQGGGFQAYAPQSQNATALPQSVLGAGSQLRGNEAFSVLYGRDPVDDEQLRRPRGQARDDAERQKWAAEDRTLWDRRTDEYLRTGGLAQVGSTLFSRSGGKTAALPIDRFGNTIDPRTGQIINSDQARQYASQAGVVQEYTTDGMQQAAAQAIQFGDAMNALYRQASQERDPVTGRSQFVDHTGISPTAAFWSGVSVGPDGMPVFNPGAGGR